MRNVFFVTMAVLFLPFAIAGFLYQEAKNSFLAGRMMYREAGADWARSE